MSYGKILKSSGLIGLVQVFQLFFGVIRNKAIALALGAKGFGIWGLYQTYIEMVSSFSTLGIDQSGVREIAKHKDDRPYQLKVIYIFQRTLLVLSIATSLLSIVFSKSISKSLFKTDNYYLGIILISFVILFNGVSKGQKSVLNGLRDLKGLATSQIIGSALGSAVTILLVLFMGMEGIPIYLLLVGFIAMFLTWLQVRKLKLEKVVPSNGEFQKELKSMVRLGLGFSISAIIASIMTYVSRTYLSREFDLSTVGIYQASWTISNLYIGIILSAMGVDFMPRMMEVVDDNKRLTALVNEQMELGFLITSIGIVGILVFSPIILQILYAKEFISGTEIIRWQVLGVALRVLGFPFSYSIMAKNKPTTYILVQALFYVSDYTLLVVFSKLYGSNGLGINYFVAYMLYLCSTWIVCKKLFYFQSTFLLRKIVAFSTFFIIVAWLISFYLTKLNLYISGIILLLIMMFWINHYLRKYMNIELLKVIKIKLKK